MGLLDDLVKALDEHPEPLPMPADHDYCADPFTAFAVDSARRHRARGVTLALFLGLTKFFRLTFLDLVDKEQWPDPETVAPASSLRVTSTASSWPSASTGRL